MSTQTSEKEFVVSRVMNAPLDLVWDVHTKEEHIIKWWGPVGFTMLKATLDLRPGGMFHYGMKGPDGNEMWGRLVYTDIKPKTQLSYKNAFSNEKGEAVPAPFDGNWPLEVQNHMFLEAQGDKTLLTLKGWPVNPTPEQEDLFRGMFSSMNEGFGGMLTYLDEYLQKLK